METSVARIPMTQGLVALVDEADAQRVSLHSWYPLRSSRSKYRTIYARAWISGKTVLLHRLILNEPDSRIDHINGDGLDCRRSNMRPATNSQNLRNRGPNRGNTSGYKGVCWQQAEQKFAARIWVDGKIIHLGYFTDPIDAAHVYDGAACRLHGEFAWLNFPDQNGRLLNDTDH